MGLTGIQLHKLVFGLLRKTGKWIFNLLVSLDQLGNSLLGGDPDETVSSRSAKAQVRGALWGRAMCRTLDVFDKGHCARSIEADEGRNASFKNKS